MSSNFKRRFFVSSISVLPFLSFLLFRLIYDGGFFSGDCRSSLFLRKSKDLGGDWGWICLVVEEKSSYIDALYYWHFESVGSPSYPLLPLLSLMMLGVAVTAKWGGWASLMKVFLLFAFVYFLALLGVWSWAAII